MTKANSKKLYSHYVKIKYEKAANNMLAKYPEFDDGTVDVSYSDMTKAELTKVATGKSLDISEAKTKDDLIVILETDSDAVKEVEAE